MLEMAGSTPGAEGEVALRLRPSSLADLTLSPRSVRAQLQHRQQRSDSNAPASESADVCVGFSAS